MHQRRDARRDLDVLDAAAQFPFGFGERLAALLGDQTRDLGEVRVEQRLELEERLNAIAGWRPSPRRQRLAGRLNGLPDIRRARQRCRS